MISTSGPPFGVASEIPSRADEVRLHSVLEGRACAVCGGPVHIRIAAWSARCDTCRSWASNLPVGGPELDTHTRITGLEPLRRENFRVILSELRSLRPLQDARILDVGSAYGWFLEEAAAAGAVAVGIEPDADIASHSTGDVRVGFFPDAIPASENFDIIAFNDVLEHLPDVPGAISICHEHLPTQGLLSINIPTADGIAFRVACVLARVGIYGPYQRLWQFGLPSPHLHYFSTKALVTLIEDRGFRVVKIRQLSSLKRQGLWQRVRMVDRPGPVHVLAFVGMYAAANLLDRPGLSDIVHIIAERTEAL